MTKSKSTTPSDGPVTADPRNKLAADALWMSFQKRDDIDCHPERRCVYVVALFRLGLDHSESL